MKGLAILATLLAMLALPALAADKPYIKIAGIEGEAKAETDKATHSDESDATANGNSASRIDRTGLHRPPVGRFEGGTMKDDVARKCNAKDNDCDAVEEDENSTREQTEKDTKK